MDELEILKKDWKKNENSFKQVTELDIYKMLHKKSSSIVKWIFIISLLEFSLWGILSFCMQDLDYMKSFNEMHVEHLLLPFNIIGYITILYFFYQFFMNYRKISVTDDLKKLMSNILRTRKTVKQYVMFNIGYAIVSVILVSYIFLNYDPKTITLMHQMAKDGHSMLFYSISIIFMLIYMAICILIIWLFYKLVYGILLKRLVKNYQELKKLDL